MFYLLKMKNKFLSLYNYLKFLNYKPYKLSSILFPSSNYSDFFIYDSECFKNIFITENSYGLLEARDIDVIHSFKFYDQKGGLIKEYNKKSKKLIETIDLPSIKSNFKYLSFTHEIKNISCLIKKENKKIKLNSRGYTKYKYRKESIGSIVHGNFGAVSSKISASIQRKSKFCYTPIFRFQKTDVYHLVFNNPTNNSLEIEIIECNENKENKFTKKLFLKTLGLDYIELRNFDSSISFISNLPICRCLIFKNPFRQSYNMDVFHS
tara:strand:- start:2417 stop:3211 length:795 start_codon:yes stop_codon:yes gene_type:complete